MTAVLPVILLIILFACVATLYTDGLWSNAVRLINVVTAALVATNFFEPVARWLEDMAPSYTYFCDFLALWGLFAISFTIFHQLTGQVSKVKVRFLNIVDRIGSGVFALWIGWVMVCFTLMTLHTAPLGRQFLFGGFKAEDKMFMGLAPDRQWLGFVQKESLGPLCRSATPEEWEREKYVFDPGADFMPKYASRREKIQENLAKTDSLRVNP
jgi:hypothetical protein